MLGSIGTMVGIQSTVAYFCMEVGLDAAIPSYAGGLGMLAGDTLCAAADLGVPMVGVTLLHRRGYFRQQLDSKGNQSESPVIWSPRDHLELLPQRVSVVIESRQVNIAAWRLTLTGIWGHTVPVYFLDTALPDNSAWDQILTDYLYGGDERYRLCQEVVLGLGGVAMLTALGYQEVQVYHMNEGHSALLSLALLRQEVGELGLASATKEHKEAVSQRCVFTTHTPVPAGHDRFSMTLVRQVLGEELSGTLRNCGCYLDGVLNMTFLALSFSRYINGVSMHHEEIAHSMFPNYPVSSITNGVHALSWTSSPFRELFDRHIPQWRSDNLYLRYAVSISLDEIRQAHYRAKDELLSEVEKRTGLTFDRRVMTVGFARRSATYKRGDLLFSDIDRLKGIAERAGPFQVIYGGKAHPKDEGGKEQIRRIFEAAAALQGSIQVVYLEEYDMSLARLLCAGVDLWLNTPRKPHEASGTSGMKASLNGVPSLSVPDGWWAEGNVEGVTGWSIGDTVDEVSDPVKEIASLYQKLEYVILPLFYNRPMDFARVMRWAIALNGSYYNAQRMLGQYLNNAYAAINLKSWVPPHTHDYDHQ